MANFSPQGQAEFDAKSAKFKSDLEAEADRLEAATRVAGAGQEITAIHVQHADLVIRQGLTPRRRHWAEVFLVLGSPGGGLAAGWALNNLEKGWGVGVLVGSVVVALGAEAIRFIKGSR